MVLPVCSNDERELLSVVAAHLSTFVGRDTDKSVDMAVAKQWFLLPTTETAFLDAPPKIGDTASEAKRRHCLWPFVRAPDIGDWAEAMVALTERQAFPRPAAPQKQVRIRRYHPWARRLYGRGQEFESPLLQPERRRRLQPWPRAAAVASQFRRCLISAISPEVAGLTSLSLLFEPETSKV